MGPMDFPWRPTNVHVEAGTRGVATTNVGIQCKVVNLTKIQILWNVSSGGGWAGKEQRIGV